MKLEYLLLIKFHFDAERLPCIGIYFFYEVVGILGVMVAAVAAVARSFSDGSPTAPGIT
jgi:uncharacterized membrane protein YjgN (DUF898 family)